MSSWDRSRYIPWSRLDQVSGEDYETQKERVYRSLQREASKEPTPKQQLEQQQQNQLEGNGFIPPEVSQTKKNKSLFQSGVPYTTADLLRSAAFGGCIGSITGAVFGFMDGMRTATDSAILKNASNMAKAKYLMQGTTQSGLTFGVFFGAFHVLKYGVRVAADPGDVVEILGAGAVSVGAMVAKPNMRANLPYAGMLIAMDSFSIYMREEK